MAFELPKGLPPGPWAYRPNKHDDWGVVRGQPGPDGFAPIIANARSGGYPTEPELAEHRLNGTDPYFFVARAIASIPDMVKEIERLRDLEAVNETAILALRANRDDAEAEIDRLRGLVECKDCMDYAWKVRAAVDARNAELVEALRLAVKIADEAQEEWDKAPSGMRAGKILIALAGGLKGYRPDTDKVHAILAKASET